MSRTYLVLGGGIAGFSAAKQIRMEDPEGRITLISAEKELPYLRPLLSKTWVSTFRRSAIHLEEKEWYAKNRIDLRLGCTVTEICPEENGITVNGTEHLAYDALVYALGAVPFVPPIPGSSHAGVRAVRTIEDFNRIRSNLALAEKVVVIGGGVVGLEMAWELSQMDVAVTVLEASDRLLSRVLDPQSSAFLKRQIEDRTISCRTGILPVGISKYDREGMPALCVELADGDRLDADLVLFSCGILRETPLAEAAGIACSRGICVDQYLRTGREGIFAAGDCLQGSPGLWNYARESGRIAGTNAAHIGDGVFSEFRPGTEPVLLNTEGFCLFAMGDLQETASTSAIVRESDMRMDTDAFLVNRRAESGRSYEKRFFRDGSLVGAVLIGDLSRMEEIRRILQNGGEIAETEM